MSKSLPMLPSLAGGSGVAAHALVDTDLLWLVDAATLNADRDRKVTLGELGTKLRDQNHVAKAGAIALVASVGQGADQHLTSVDVAGLPVGTWLLTGWVELRPDSSTGPSIPRYGTITFKCGATTVSAQYFELDQRRNDQGGATVYRTQDVVQFRAVVVSTGASTVFTASINAMVGTSGGDTYKIQDGIMLLQRIWLS